MEDVQSQPDDRGIALDRVGVAGLRCPIVVLDRSQSKQQTSADLRISVSLPASVKGTHMSRFVEVPSDESIHNHLAFGETSWSRPIRFAC
jgi:GTP cyclohydrolase I